MDKKIGIIIGILVVVVVGLIGFAFLADSNDSSILTINDIGYDKAGFEKFYKLKYYEEKQSAEDDNAEIDKEELKETALNEYASYLIINKEAKDKGYKLNDTLISAVQSAYDSENVDKELLNSLGLTKEDYVEASLVEDMANDFVENVDEYYDVPESSVELYFETNKNTLKGYDFRIMQFNITSTEATQDEEGNEIPATSNKDEIVAKAEAVLERVKAGEDFETLAKENADSRYALVNSELKQYNGELESVDLPYLSSYLMFSCSELADPIKALENVGDYTELTTTDSYVAFARLEAVRDDITEETRTAMEKEVKQSIGSSYLSSVVQSSSVIINSRLLKSIEI